MLADNEAPPSNRGKDVGLFVKRQSQQGRGAISTRIAANRALPEKEREGRARYGGGELALTCAAKGRALGPMAVRT